MKILHLCLSASYVEGLSYQENILSQYHKKMGYDVDVISSLKTFNKDGEYVYDKDPSSYVNKFGIHVDKLAYKRPIKYGKLFRTYKGAYEAIEKSNPDIIFCHGVQFKDAAVLIKYMKKHPDVKLYCDNHSDFSNSATNWISKNLQHKCLWRYYVQKLNPYVKKFFGVLPARVDFLIDMYKLPKEKVELLVMGADDSLVEKASSPEVIEKTRKKYGIDKDDFLIINGGKIDQWKKQTLLLMDAVNQMDDPRIKLLVFGSVTPELKDDVEKRCTDRVKYIGWVQSDDSYELFSAGNIACFPGRHSVFWEQVAGQGIPMIVKYWDGTTHVDRGGNAIFLYRDNVEEIQNAIEYATQNQAQMLIKAIENQEHFLYSGIAKHSIEG